MERPLEHGLLTTYVNRRCHCASCTGAAREYGRRRARLRAYGRLEELVPLETVATHIKWLAAQGLGSRQIAHLANVSRPTVDEITSPSGPRRGVTPRVASAILAVLPGLDSCADKPLVPAAGTQRRLQALMVLGWPLAEIQRATAAAALHKCMTRAQVTARLARTPTGTATPPPDPTSRPRASPEPSPAPRVPDGCPRWPGTTTPSTTRAAPPIRVRSGPPEPACASTSRTSSS